MLLLLTLCTLLLSPSVVVLTHAAKFEVAVSKPAAHSDTQTGGVLGVDGSKIFTSKYLGNSIVTNAKNLGYSGTIVLGDNPPQSFDVVFDTGSDMVVGSGPIVMDKVSIGGLVLQSQQILDITKSGLDLSSYGPRISGLVGLMPSSPVLNAVPPLATMYKSKLLDMNVFSVYLAPTLKQNQGGSFLFGGVDNTKFVGSLNQVPISTASGVREGMWYIDADNASVGGVPVAGYSKSPWLFDTGTSFIAVPTSFAQAFHSKIPGSSYSATDQIYTLPCTGNKTFGISFNGIQYEVPYLDYIATIGGKSSLCVSLVMPLGDYEMYILGDPFLRQVYAVYDFTPGASRIGLAKIDVTNASLGCEGLSGDPVPGGAIVTPLRSSMGKSWVETAPRLKMMTSLAIGLSVAAAAMLV
ncbi:Vacuolar protease A [Dissophora ornata]|nr:Vacuolar protease A [Dissophora ornata]